MEGGLFRSRLSKEFNERTARFHTSVVDDLRIFEEDIDGTEAHNIMLHEQDIIPLSALKLILQALEDIRDEWRRGEVEIGTEFEDVHEYIEARVIEKTGLRAGGMLHTGRSRNDQVMVDVRLRVREELIETAEKILALISSMLSQAENHVETVMILYTHGQHAQIGTFAHYLTAYSDALIRDVQRLMECYARVNRNPLGAGPIGGTSIAIDRQRTTELLGFDDLVENSMDATSGRDWAIEAAAANAILMSNVSRTAADLIDWSRPEFGYVELADEYSSSSSIMPQKKNPSTLELIRGRAGEVYGALIELLTMVKGIPTGYQQDLQGTKTALWRCFDTVTTSLEVITGVISTIKVREARMLEIAEESPAVALDLTERLVEEKDLTFREAYRLVAALVNDKLGEGQGLQDLEPSDLSRVSLEIIGKAEEVDKSFIENILDPSSSLKNRKSQGSPHPTEVRRMIKERRLELKEYEKMINNKKSLLTAAKKSLDDTVRQYISK